MTAKEEGQSEKLVDARLLASSTEERVKGSKQLQEAGKDEKTKFSLETPEGK